MPAFRQWIRSLETNEIAAAGLFVTIVIATIYFFQLLSMQDTVKAMEVQTRLSVRPFVGLDEGPDALQTTPLQIDEHGNATLKYTVRAKDYSNFPASNVWADANLVVADDLNTVYEQQSYACGDAVIGKPDIGFLLFQGRDRVFVAMPAMATITIQPRNKYVAGVSDGMHRIPRPIGLSVPHQIYLDALRRCWPSCHVRPPHAADHNKRTFPSGWKS